MTLKADQFAASGRRRGEEVPLRARDRLALARELHVVRRDAPPVDHVEEGVEVVGALVLRGGGRRTKETNPSWMVDEGDTVKEC